MFQQKADMRHTLLRVYKRRYIIALIRSNSHQLFISPELMDPRYFANILWKFRRFPVGLYSSIKVGQLIKNRLADLIRNRSSLHMNDNPSCPCCIPPKYYIFVGYLCIITTC